MVWGVTSFSTGMVLTSPMMTALQNNHTAITAADSGAPTIVSSAIALDTISRQHLDTLTNSLAGVSPSGQIKLSAWCFMPHMATIGIIGFSGLNVGQPINSGSADLPGFGGTSGVGSYDIAYRYLK